MTQDPFVGDAYEMRPHLARSRQTEGAQATDLYEDERGRWISAAAPIRASDGEIVRLLEVNRPADAYFARTESVFMLNAVIGLVGLAIWSLLGWFVLRRLIINPVREIHEEMQALGRHDFNHQVKLKTGDELQELGDTLNRLFDQLNVARSIQAGFFPEKLPERGDYCFAASSDPCDATGGDYYDAFDVDDDHTAIVVADVSGHGRGPSLLMASCRSVLQALGTAKLDPGDLLQYIDRLLAPDLRNGRFITMIYGVLSTDGTFTYANAGHAPAMVVSNGGVTHLESHRPPLGIQIDLDREVQTTIRLAAGDRVLFTSDGVNEAQDPAGQQFGQDRIEQVVNDRDLDCAQVVGRLQNDLSGDLAGVFQHEVVAITVVGDRDLRGAEPQAAGEPGGAQ